MTTALPNTIIQGNCIGGYGRDAHRQRGDFILTDPPYIAAYKSRDNQTVRNDDNAAWLTPSFVQMHRVLKQDAFAISFYGWPKVDLFFAAWKGAGFRIGGHIVFRKRYASKSAFLQYRHEAAYLLSSWATRAFSGIAFARCDGLDVHRQQAAPDAEIHSHPETADRELHAARRACA